MCWIPKQLPDLHRAKYRQWAACLSFLGIGVTSSGLPGSSGKHQEKLAGCGGELHGVGLCIHVTLQCRAYIPSLLTLGLATWRALTNGVGADMTWVEGLNIPVWLSLTLRFPATHQRKTLPHVAATPSAWVPDWETFGADLNPASRKVAPADGQTCRWGRSMLVVSEWNFGHICYWMSFQSVSK